MGKKPHVMPYTVVIKKYLLSKGLDRKFLLRWLILISLLLIGCLLSDKAQGQGQANIWYFGNGAGLDFNSSPPVLLTNGNTGLNLSDGEGVGTIADAGGNLLFYTNGVTVYNRNHVSMPNGTALDGDGSATQTGLIVPHPGNANQYYIFTTKGGGGNMRYTIVDMTLDGGLGDVVVASKNILMQSTALECALAVPKDDGSGYWIIGHDYSSTNFRVWDLTSAGLAFSATYSVGVSVTTGVSILKTNGCYNTIAISYWNAPSQVKIHPFNSATGVIGAAVNTISSFPDSHPYGLEFSPNGRYLYVSESGLNGVDNLHQFDLQAGSDALIDGSRYTWTPAASNIPRCGVIQMGPDGKIYVSQSQTTAGGYIGVVNSPDLAAPGCNYVNTQIPVLSGKLPREGLPPVLRNFINNNLNILVTNACEGSPSQFSFTAGSTPSSDPNSIIWDWGDGSSNTIDQLSPVHTYAVANTYTVTLTVTDICGRVRVTSADVIIKPGPQVTVPSNACPDEDVVLTGTGPNAANYTWSENPAMTPLLGTGSSYTYNGPLPKTIYVEDPTPLANYTAGNTTAADNFGSDQPYTYFEVFTDLTITSLELRSRAAGTTDVYIQNQAGTTTYYGPVSISPAAAGQTFTLNPNVDLSPGIYRFSVSNIAVVFRNNTSVDGGRDVSGVIDVTGHAYPATGNRGGPFYNIGVSIPDPCGIRAYTIEENCPLPVELIQFNALKNGNEVNLFWNTSWEANSSHFIVQRSADGNAYEDIGYVTAAGNSTDLSTYFFADLSPLPEYNYYRLIQFDRDNKYILSNTVVINMSGLNITVAPNPFADKVRIDFLFQSDAIVTVYDHIGRIAAEFYKDENDVTVFLGDQLVPGSYILRVQTESLVKYIKVVKQ